MKKTLFAEYTAPEMEIISTNVEAGFSISDVQGRAFGFENAETTEYGDDVF